MDKQNSLIEQYYSSIVDIMDLEQIDSFLPEYSYYAFFNSAHLKIFVPKDFFDFLTESGY